MMKQERVRPVKNGPGGREQEVQVKDKLTHPFARIESAGQREKYTYRFLRVTRFPIAGRPDSGRILVQNESSGERRDLYAALFDISFVRL
jgi:hypothetical protein